MLRGPHPINSYPLAQFSKGLTATRPTIAVSSGRVEIFYFLPQGWLDRALAAQRDLSVLDRWWGRSDWGQLRDMRPHDRAQIMVERFKAELKY